MFKPRVDGLQGFSIETVEAQAAVAALLDEAGATEQAQVLGDGGAGDRKGMGDLAGGKAASAEQIEDGAACGVGESGEGRRALICSRTVTHYM